MANSTIAASNPARDVLNSIIRKSSRKVSKRDLIIVTEEYGAYCKAMECDLNLIRDTIRETPRKDLADALNDLYAWYWKMDCIAAQ